MSVQRTRLPLLHTFPCKMAKVASAAPLKAGVLFVKKKGKSDPITELRLTSYYKRFDKTLQKSSFESSLTSSGSSRTLNDGKHGSE